jgi:hypothetical protein
MNMGGQGVRKIRIRDAAGIFRVLYVAKFDEAVYVDRFHETDRFKLSDLIPAQRLRRCHERRPAVRRAGCRRSRNPPLQRTTGHDLLIYMG